MHDSLTFTADLEEYSLGLRVSAKSGKFSGSSEAWFNTEDVADFISNLRRYTHDTSFTPKLSGGIWHSTKKELIEEHVSIRTYRLSTHKIGLHIKLTHRPSTEIRPEELQTVILEFTPNFHDIICLCDQLEDLIAGKVQQASLPIN